MSYKIKRRILLGMLVLNAVLLVFSSFVMRDLHTVLVNIFGCATSWLSVSMLDWVERLDLESKNKLGEEHDDE